MGIEFGAPVLTSAAIIAALGYTPVNKAGDTITGALTVNVAGTPLVLESTGVNGSRQTLVLDGINSSPAANDTVYLAGRVTNTSAAQKEVARLSFRATTVTAGAEAGMIVFGVSVAGTMTDRYVVSTGAMRAAADDVMAMGAAGIGWQGIYISSTRFIDFGNNNVRITHSTGALNFNDGCSFSFGTSTGTKIGTSTSQKIGFFNATPVVQPTSVTETAAGIKAALITLGLFGS